MDDQLDNDLKNHIRKVFDEYEDPSADEGWLLLRKKFPAERAGRRPVAWAWWSAAALLLLCLGIGLWRYSAIENTQKLSAKKTVAPNQENIATSKATPATVTKSGSSGNPVKSVPANHIAAAPVMPSKLQTTRVRADKYAVNKRNIAKGGVDATPVVKQPAVQQLTAAVQTNNQAAVKPGLPAKSVVPAHPDSVKHAVIPAPANQLAANSQVNKVDVNATPVKPGSQAQDASSMFTANNTPRRKKSDDLSPRVRFGLFAGTYYSYSKGSVNQTNVGAGITSDIRLTKHLKLVTGVAVGGNSLSFNDGVPTVAAQTSVSLVPGAAMTVAGNASAFTAKTAVTSATTPAFKNYGASVVGIDIPLNLKYEFNPGKNNNIYLMTGLSSGTFINETYTYQYNYPAFLSPQLQQVQAQTSHKSFNSFYFAKMLNVAVGYPIAGNRVVVEPFLKYPLEGLGTQKIRFGSGGLNLKFNFIPARK